MVNTKCKTTEKMVDRLQNLEGKPKLKFYNCKSFCHGQFIYMIRSYTFRFEENRIGNVAQDIAFKMHETLLLMKLSETEPQGKLKFYLS